MKKYLFLFAVAAMTLAANAQTESTSTETTKVTKFYDGSRFLDNWYVGINGGVGGATKAFNANGNIGLRLGKHIIPALGFGIEGNYYFNNKADGVEASKGGYSQIGMFADLNLMNTFAGYKGQPRPFEIYLLTGFYWGHNYGDKKESLERNTLVHKIAFDFAYNFGKQREWQVYFEPSLNYAIAGVQASKGYKVEYNINNSFLNFNLGVVYKFRNANGTHSFKVYTPRNEEEINSLNNTIANLRNVNDAQSSENSQLKQQVNQLQQALDAEKNKPAQPKTETKVVSTIPAVVFDCNKSFIIPGKDQNISVVAKLMKKNPDYKVNIKGYASVEGSAERNEKLAVSRAEAVKKKLVQAGIDASRITCEGCGTTDKLSDTQEFNRAAVIYLQK